MSTLTSCPKFSGTMTSLIGIEFLKLRRSRIFFILLIPALMMWLPAVINAGASFQTEEISILPEYNFFIQGFMGMSWFMIPATAVICTVLLNQTERIGRGALKMLSLPVSTRRICLAKFLVLIVLLALQMLLSLLCYYGSALIASSAENYNFLLSLPYACLQAARIYLAVIPMAAVFWMLAVLIRTPVLSAGIGLFSIAPSVLFLNTRFWAFYPMDYSFYMLMTEYGRKAEGIFTDKIQWLPLLPVAFAITLICLGISCTRFGKSEI